MRQRLKLIFTVLALYCSWGTVYGLPSIIGSTAVVAGQTYQYEFSNSMIYTDPWWDPTTLGTVVSTWQSGDTYYAIVRWTTSGTGTIRFKNGATIISSKSITIALPDTPTATFTQTQKCNTTVVRRQSSPSADYDWYWQTSSTGTSTTIGNLDSILVTTTGPLYLRTRSKYSPNPWSAALQSVGTITVVSPLLAPATSTDGHVISNAAAQVTLSVSAVSGATTYAWYQQSSGGAAISGQTAITYAPTVSQTKTYYVESVIGSCASTSRKAVTANVYPEPIVGATNNGLVTMGNAVTLSTTNFTYDTYQWLDGNGNSISGATGSTYATKVAGNYKVSVGKATSPLFTAAQNYVVTTGLAGVSMNYITTNAFLKEGVTVTDVDTLSIKSLNQSTQFFDDLGRPVQTVVTQGSPLKKDIIQPAVYDQYGRENRKYLPVVPGASNGWYQTITYDGTGNYSGQAANFYSNNSAGKIAQDTKPFAETVFEASPLNRPTKNYGAGQAWSNKYVETQYATNIHNTGVSTTGEKVIAWDISTTGMPVRTAAKTGYIEAGGYYSSGQLILHVTIDEQGNAVREYKNKEGHVILKKVQAVANSTNLNSTTDWALTYYVYDDFGNLRYVLPPELSKLIHTNADTYAVTAADINSWAFVYKYDIRNRMTVKKVPGADSVFMIHDALNRLILTQDANLRAFNKWMFTKYDGLNRPILTGIRDTTSITRVAMQAVVDAYFAKASAKWETYVGNASGNVHGYTNKAYPVCTGVTAGEVDPNKYLTVTYYDNYNFVTDLSWGANYSFATNDIIGQETTNNTRLTGHSTGSKTIVLGTTTFLKSVVYYDAKYRTIQTIADNNKGGWDRTTSVLDFPGRVLNTKTTHHTSTHSDQTIARRYVYDHASRLKQLFHTVSSAPEVLLAQNNYNEIGQLVEKNLHCKNCGDPAASQPNTVVAGTIQRSAYSSTEQNLLATQMIVLGTGYSVSSTSGSLVAKLETTTSATVPVNGGQYFQSVDYRYNIRGWLLSMNNSQLANDGVINDDTNDLFGMELGYNNSIGTGNAALYNGNISSMKWSSNLALGTVKDVGYNYTYDALNRITGASYATNTAGVWANATNAFSESGYNYDLNGNIKTLQRSGSSGTIDNLSYIYNGNQQLTITDASDKTKGFKEPASTTGNDFTYDANGNVIVDQNQSVSSITYNYHNLPEQIIKATGEKSVYVYDANGKRLSHSNYNVTGNLTKKIDYVGEFIYQGDTLQFINQEEGRIMMTTGEYQYHLHDHLGNVRLTFTTKKDVDANTATYETTNTTTEQSKFLRYTNARRINSVLFDHTNGNSTGYAERLNGTINERDGLARSMSVMPGDTVKMEVYVKYLDTNNNDWTAALTTLMGQIAANNSSVVVDGANYSTSGSSFPYAMGLNGTTSSTGTGPKAYMNWLVFDRNYVFKNGGYVRMSDVAKEYGQDCAHEKLTASIPISGPGYVYVYLSNENDTPVEVYFDDWKVTQTKSPVVQQQDYYAFGGDFNKYSRESSVPNKYLYNKGSELHDDQGVQIYLTDLRDYDPWGRMGWWQIDPVADHGQESWTPYHYAYDNPIFHNDPKGDCPPDTYCPEGSPEEEMAGVIASGVSDGLVGLYNLTIGYFTHKEASNDGDGITIQISERQDPKTVKEAFFKTAGNGLNAISVVPAPTKALGALAKTGSGVKTTFGNAAKELANAGRSGKQARLKELAKDPKVGSADKGWIKNEMRQVANGNRKTIRLPGNSRNSKGPGKVLAHPKGQRAKDGHSYKDAKLQDTDLHKLEHKHEGY